MLTMTRRKNNSKRAPRQPHNPRMKRNPPMIMRTMAGLVSTEPNMRDSNELLSFWIYIPKANIAIPTSYMTKQKKHEIQYILLQDLDSYMPPLTHITELIRKSRYLIARLQ